MPRMPDLYLQGPDISVYGGQGAARGEKMKGGRGGGEAANRMRHARALLIIVRRIHRSPVQRPRVSAFLEYLVAHLLFLGAHPHGQRRRLAGGDVLARAANGAK